MKNYRYIYLLGSLFLVIALAKYIFVPTVLPPLFFTFEIVSFLFVLALTYYSVTNFDLRSNNSLEKQCDDRDRLIKENTVLKTKVEKLELEKASDQTYQSKEALFLSALTQLVSSETKNIGQALLNLISEQFELIAGIAYEKHNSKSSFQPISTFGIDDDWKIEPVKQGEGLHGQTISNGIAMELSEIPEDYFEANSGTGNAHPAYIYILPYQTEKGNSWLLEIASFKALGLHIMWNKHLESAQ